MPVACLSDSESMMWKLVEVERVGPMGSRFILLSPPMPTAPQKFSSIFLLLLLEMVKLSQLHLSKDIKCELRYNFCMKAEKQEFHHRFQKYLPN